VPIGEHSQESDTTKINLLATKLLADIPYEILVVSAHTTESIISIAKQYQATTIIVAKNNSDTWKEYSGSISQQLLENATIPITFV
jgi:nucleotide-binding universal stress UspA family protein